MKNQIWTSESNKRNIFESEIDINQFCQQIKEVLYDQYWRLCDGVYQKYNWYHIFFVMVQSSAKRLILSNNINHKIILQIQHVGFHHLKNLNLNGNSINNIQALSFIDSPNLQILRLCQNNICQIKSLVKNSFNLLHLISTNLNPIKDISRLSRQRFHQQKLKLHMKFGIAYHKQLVQDQFKNKKRTNSIGYIRSLSEVVKFDSALYELTRNDEDAYCEIYLGTVYELWQSKIRQMLQKRYFMIKFSQFELF